MTEELRPSRPLSPGEILKEELDAHGWTQVLNGEKEITLEISEELSRAFGSSPEFWLHLQDAYAMDLLHYIFEKSEES